METAPAFSLSSRASRQVDGALVNLRWTLLLLAWLTLFILNGALVPNNFFLVWLITYAVFNMLLWIGVRHRQIPARLPQLGLIGDILFLSLLPLLPGVNNPFFILFAIFPTLVAAMRFGVGVGLLATFISLLPYEATAILALLSESAQGLVPIAPESTLDWFTMLFPIVTLVGTVVMVGYLAQREREAAVGAAAVELDELRQAIASARLFYESTNKLSNVADYNQILDVMLQAGVIGMPHGRGDGAQPIGMALLFEPRSPDQDQQLKVTAWRNLDRADTQRRVPGKEGIIARALETGEPVLFGKAAADPELSQFSTLSRMRAGICYPLQSGLDVYGIVILATPVAQMPPEQHLRLMRAFINQAAIAFQNAQLYHNLRLERKRIIEAEASARNKLARDLHDGPAQSLTALVMRLDLVRLLLDQNPEQAKQELEQMREAVMRVSKDLRNLLFTLRPLTLETHGLSAALSQYAQRLRDTEGLAIELNPGNIGTELDPNVAATVFAIIEEAVNNARKHASGAPIHVSVDQQNGALLAIVRDEGPGFDVNSVMQDYAMRGSLGLINMQDRARLIEGQLAIDSAPGRGTRITLYVPLKADQLKSRDNQAGPSS